MFCKAVQSFIQNMKASGKSDLTVEAYQGTLEAFKAVCDIYSIDAFEPSAIACYKAYLHEEKANKASTITLRLSHLSVFFDFCVGMKIINESPCNPILMSVKKEKKKPYEHLLDEKSIAKILYGEKPENVTRKVYARNRAIITIFLTSGIRNSELSALTLEDIDFTANVIYVKNGKGGKYRVVALPEVAKKAIFEWLHSEYRPKNLPVTAPLFGSIGKDGKYRAIGRTAMSDTVECYIRAAVGQNSVRSHALRHASASFMLSNGASIEDIQALLGHESCATTARYAELLRPQSPAQRMCGVFDHVPNLSVAQ